MDFIVLGEEKRREERGWFLPEAVVAAGHDQRAVSVEVNLRANARQRAHRNQTTLFFSTAELTAETGSE